MILIMNEKKEQNKMSRVVFHIPKHTSERLRKLAFKLRISRSGIIRDAITAYLKNESTTK